MLSGINGVHHVAISVPDLEQAKDFYCNVLGMKEVDALAWQDSAEADEVTGLANSAARLVLLKAGNAYVELFEYTSPPPKPADPDRPVCDHGFTHLALDVTDVDAVYADLVAKGMRFHHPPYGDLAAEGVRMTYGRDPFGNVIELQEVSRASGFTLEPR